MKRGRRPTMKEMRGAKVSPEAMAWAESLKPEIDAYKAANPNWLAETKPLSDLLAKRPKR